MKKILATLLSIGAAVSAIAQDTTPEMLKKIDVLVIDLQDVGARSYTYASCMLLAMETCFEAGKEVIVLDRPNPLGGLKVDGPMLDMEFKSYVGMFPAPYVHGLTNRVDGKGDAGLAWRI